MGVCGWCVCSRLWPVKEHAESVEHWNEGCGWLSVAHNLQSVSLIDSRQTLQSRAVQRSHLVQPLPHRSPQPPHTLCLCCNGLLRCLTPLAGCLVPAHMYSVHASEEHTCPSPTVHNAQEGGGNSTCRVQSTCAHQVVCSLVPKPLPQSRPRYKATQAPPPKQAWVRGYPGPSPKAGLGTRLPRPLPQSRPGYEARWCGACGGFPYLSWQASMTAVCCCSCCSTDCICCLRPSSSCLISPTACSTSTSRWMALHSLSSLS